MQAIPLKNRNANCERLLKQKPPPRGRKGRGVELTQVMDDAVYLSRCKYTLLPSVTESLKFILERLADIYPMLQFFPCGNFFHLREI